MPEAPVDVREARAEDLETIVGFNAAMALETEGRELDRSILTAGVRAILEDPGKGRYWVATVDGAVVGQLMVTYEWSDWRNGMFLWIQSVYVRPDHRRGGVFTALYRHVERASRAPGSCGLRLYVHDDNDRAHGVYRRLGMEACAYRVFETPDVLE